MPEPRLIAGIRCDEVLEHLSDYLDDSAAADIRAAIEGHLAECDWCERFGGEFGQTIAGIRRTLGSPEEPSGEVLERLAARLAVESVVAAED